VPVDDFKKFWSTAEEISPDPDDVVYFAVALAHRCPIWTNDRALKNQRKVKILSTRDLAELLGK
jgi:predicted nucleic acid-binding protein